MPPWGLPFYTVTLLSPRLGWTFDAPAGVLVIDAHPGRIARYAWGDSPSGVDRVYSQKMAMAIANWYGQYSQAGFQGLGSSNANRFQVSGEPVMVYTGTGHPFWRMLLTSHNNDNSVSRIIEMSAAAGAIRIYTPQRPMGIEDPVTQAFDNAVYVGTVASVGPALVLAKPGDPVTISILNIGAQASTQTIQSFTDAHVPLHGPGA